MVVIWRFFILGFGLAIALGSWWFKPTWQVSQQPAAGVCELYSDREVCTESFLDGENCEWSLAQEKCLSGSFRTGNVGRVSQADSAAYFAQKVAQGAPSRPIRCAETCGANADCSRGDSGWHCKCLPDFAGDGFFCGSIAKSEGPKTANILNGVKHDSDSHRRNSKQLEWRKSSAVAQSSPWAPEPPVCLSNHTRKLGYAKTLADFQTSAAGMRMQSDRPIAYQKFISFARGRMEGSKPIIMTFCSISLVLANVVAIENAFVCCDSAVPILSTKHATSRTSRAIQNHYTCNCLIAGTTGL